MKKLFLLLTALTVLTFNGCKKSPQEKKLKPSDICGVWNIESMTGFDISDTKANIVITKEGKKYLFSGSSGVNYFHTTLEDSENVFPVSSDLAITRMSASPEEMKIEDEILKFFSSGTWNLSENKLKITRDSKELVYIKK